jgi:DNA gyrase/topoisomerase IV subunit B
MQYNAGVLKTFDEIIVNAVDRQVEVESMREIRVRIDAATGELEVWNDGPGISPVPHKSGKGLVPEVAFGEFMASTNFDDNTRKRFTGGRFGVGTSICVCICLCAAMPVGVCVSACVRVYVCITECLVRRVVVGPHACLCL